MCRLHRSCPNPINISHSWVISAPGTLSPESYISRLFFCSEFCFGQQHLQRRFWAKTMTSSFARGGNWIAKTGIHRYYCRRLRVLICLAANVWWTWPSSLPRSGNRYQQWSGCKHIWLCRGAWLLPTCKLWKSGLIFTNLAIGFGGFQFFGVFRLFWLPLTFLDGFTNTHTDFGLAQTLKLVGGVYFGNAVCSIVWAQ